MYPTRTFEQLMDGVTVFAAAPVNGEVGAPPVYSVSPEWAKGVILHFDMAGATFSFTFTIKGWNIYAAVPAAGPTILASATKSSAAGFDLTVYPGAATTSNVSAGLVMPKYWTLAITGTSTDGQVECWAEYIP